MKELIEVYHRFRARRGPDERGLRGFPWAAAGAAPKLPILGCYVDISTGILGAVEPDHVTPIDEVMA
jgi:hypothetical protein